MESGWRPVVIGWNEYVDLPDWDIAGLRAKSDTGAKTSALHVENVERIGTSTVKFDVVLARVPRRRKVTVRSRISRVNRVKSSNGHYSQRIFVRTTLRIGPLEREIEVSLVDRETMTYRMLLGRAALNGLLVDSRRDCVLGTRPRRRNVSKRKAHRKS